MSDQRVEAIRKHSMVGNGSCTTIDEATTDEELIAELDEVGATTVEQAVAWALETEGLRIENATNKRWGEDDDPELQRLEDWKDQLLGEKHEENNHH